jgi:cysteinyl-tRNA synthetase
MIKLYDTLSGKKEALPDTPKLRLFVCGPTVYDHAHIGNARTFVTFDLFVRYLRSQRINVFYLQNITDIDDKIIDRARQEKSSWEEVARNYEKIFLDDMKRLGVISVDRYARATDFIPEIVAQVKTLIEKKHAYLIEGDGWYFDLSTFPDYGKLARRTTAQAEDGTSRIDMSDRKKNRGDFALWKFSKAGEPSWKSELGAGRPGWHIEDTAISEHFFGPQYDIHGGALDLKFPHHEAEIAQQESASGLVPFVKIWMHSGFLTVNGEKMSKSLKNFITIEDLLRDHPVSVFRMMVFMHHYRSPLDYTELLAETARKNRKSVSIFAAKLTMAAREAKSGKNAPKAFAELEEELNTALADDFNTPKALAVVFDHMAKLQPNLWELPRKEAESMAEGLEGLFATFGITLEKPEIPAEVKKLAEARDESRGNEHYEQADRLRREIDALGYEVEDTPRGPFVWPKDLN